MIKHLFLLTILTILQINFLSAQPPAVSQLSVSLDVESAQSICSLLATNKADMATINKVAGLYGNTLLIKKVKGYSGAGEDVFKHTLQEIIETGTIKGDDPYNWKLVKQRLPEINALLQYLLANKEQFIAELKTLIQPFVPDTLQATARACFLAGGGALGFTIGGDPTFNVALQKVGDDVEGLKYLVAHELYHTMQDAGQRTRKFTKDTTATYAVEASYYLLYNLWSEGIANYVGDFMKIKQPKTFSKEQLDEYNKNAARTAENFRLFEALLYRQYYDTTARYQASYNIAFTTAFDETSYFVGYEMARQIAKNHGDKALADLLVQDPIQFTADYIQLYKMHEGDKNFIRFSTSIENIINDLMSWKNKL